MQTNPPAPTSPNLPLPLPYFCTWLMQLHPCWREVGERVPGPGASGRVVGTTARGRAQRARAPGDVPEPLPSAAPAACAAVGDRRLLTGRPSEACWRGRSAETKW